MGRPYWGWRFQIDPMSPAPRRDVRYVMIVTGIAMTILALLLLAVSAIISDAISLGTGSCATPPCSAVDPGPWFAWIALPFLLLGVALLVVGVWWGIRPTAAAR
jgi:hypothetical protein